MRNRYALILLLLLPICSGLAGTARSQETNTESSRKVVRKTIPLYPEVAKRINLAGTVKVIAVVGADGDVKSVEPKGGSPILLKAAEDAVSKWKFAAGGESRETIEVHFAP